MAKYIAKRVALALVTLVIVSMLTFFLMFLVPGGPFLSEKSPSPAVLAAMEEKYGLDKPVIVQYKNYMLNLLQGELGPSIKQRGRTVAQIIGSRFPVSARIGGIALAIAVVVGVVLGSVVALVRVAHDQQRPGRRNPVLGFFNAVCQVYTTIIRGTPMMVQLLIMSMVIFSNSRNFTMVGALALGINSGAYVSEIIRGGLMAVDPGQMEAGRSLGLNYMTTMVVIVIPQAIRAVLPALGNEFIVLLKDTSLITVIGGKELLYAAQGIMNRTYEAMFPLLGVAVVYLVLVMLFTWLLSKFERRMAQGDR